MPGVNPPAPTLLRDLHDATRCVEILELFEKKSQGDFLLVAPPRALPNARHAHLPVQCAITANPLFYRMLQ
jgi:hypothetical protein